MSAKTPAMSPSDLPVDAVLDRATGARRAEAEELLELHEQISGEKPVVWAGRIIGFGQYEYRYDTGHGGIAPLLAFAPSATKHTIYLVNDFAEKWPDLMERLGKHKSSKVCLYLTRMTEVDREALGELLQRSLNHTRAEWG